MYQVTMAAPNVLHIKDIGPQIFPKAASLICERARSTVSPEEGAPLRPRWYFRADLEFKSNFGGKK